MAGIEKPSYTGKPSDFFQALAAYQESLAIEQAKPHTKPYGIWMNIPASSCYPQKDIVMDFVGMLCIIRDWEGQICQEWKEKDGLVSNIRVSAGYTCSVVSGRIRSRTMPVWVPNLDRHSFTDWSISSSKPCHLPI